MKQIKLAVLILMLIFLAGCSQLPVLRRLPDYEVGGLHACYAFQDSTEYGEYTFADVTAQQLRFSGYFQIVQEADLETLRLYVKNFEEWVEICACEDCDCCLAECYNFSPDLLEAGDYFGLERVEPRGNFLGDYTIHYFDMDTQTLYYLRCNI